MATQSSILAWRIPWVEEPGGLQPMRSLRVKHNCATNTLFFLIYTTICKIAYIASSAWCSVATLMGRMEGLRGDICKHIADSLCYATETTQHCKATIP